MTKQDILIRKIHEKIDTQIAVLLSDDFSELEIDSLKFIHMAENLKYDSKPYCFLKETIKNFNKKVLLIGNKSRIHIMNRLLWESDNVNGVLYVDIENPYMIEETVTNKDRMLWDIQANRSDSQAVMSGWLNSYNNEEFSKEELEEYIDNTRQKIGKYINNNTSMLEVGIGSGILALQMAPMCNNYDGCDISSLVLDKLKTLTKKNDINNVQLFNYAADEINKIKKKYDIILMSSVTEYFSGYNYLRKVIRKCIDLIDDKGTIMLADIFDLAKKEQYRQSVYSYADAHPGCRFKRDFSHELFIPREYWKDIANTFLEIDRVLISDKLGTIPNEINTFRYDVIFEINKTAGNRQNREKRKLYKYQFGMGSSF